jgi:hypothetical protein
VFGGARTPHYVGATPKTRRALSHRRQSHCDHSPIGRRARAISGEEGPRGSGYELSVMEAAPSAKDAERTAKKAIIRIAKPPVTELYASSFNHICRRQW